MIVVSAILAAVFAGWRLFKRIRFFLHIHQLEGYRPGPYLRWVSARPLDVVLRWSHVTGSAILVGLLWLGIPGSAALLLWAFAFSSSRRYRRDRPKKPLVMTARMTRQAVGTGILTAGLWVAAALIFHSLILAPIGSSQNLAAGLFGVLAADLLAPFSVWLAGLLLTPAEWRIRQGFKQTARTKLAARPDLIIVAVTGSYGKTSVKFAIAQVLAQRYQVLATPGSFNTPMGICKVINNDLRAHHQVLVLEMGIRHPGDISELCAIARPNIAVVTGIGIAHLESMGSIDAIAREKGSLLAHLLPNGRAVLNADDPYFQQMATGQDVISVSGTGRPADLMATRVEFGPEGTSFQVSGPVLASADRPQSAHVGMELLGRHHVGNALLALAVGHTLGIRLRSGSRALARQAPVPHRLSMRQESGLLILDDAFNSNPVGAQNAIEVLGQFAPRRRFVVTPGMIELGQMEYEANRALGAAMVESVDDAILVGPARTAAIAEGLRENGMRPERIHVTSTLFEAKDLLTRLSKAGDVVLFENDLPDQYTEA